MHIYKKRCFKRSTYSHIQFYACLTNRITANSSLFYVSANVNQIERWRNISQTNAVA